jgi:hypothetical protein
MKTFALSSFHLQVHVCKIIFIALSGFPGQSFIFIENLTLPGYWQRRELNHLTPQNSADSKMHRG